MVLPPTRKNGHKHTVPLGSGSVAKSNYQKSRAESNVAEVRFRPSTFLTTNEYRRLTRLNWRKLVSALGFDFGVILFAVLLSESVQHPLIYLLALMTIAARQAGIGSVALHDGVHHLLSKRKSVNDAVGRFLSTIVFTPLVVGFSAYRKSHFDHHRSTNTDDDPDLAHLENFFKGNKSQASLRFLLPLTGILFVVAAIRYPLKNWRNSPGAVAAFASFVGILAAGLVHSVYAAQLVLWYWVVPLATWGVFVNQLRILAEHYPENEFTRGNEFPEIFRTRDVVNSWFDDWFVVTRGVNFHLSHHLCPQVPFYNLAELQSKLAEHTIYRRYGHVTCGYHRVLAEHFFHRDDAVGLPAGRLICGSEGT